MKKRITILLLALCLLLGLPLTGSAEEMTDARSGSCGEGITWALEGYTLTVSGSGEMDDGAPWEAHKDHIEHVIFAGGITKIGAEAFYQYDRIETVDFGDALVEIGEKAFYGCEDIEIIHLPKTFRKFGAEAFRGCTSLEKVYCDGGMPRFENSCLWTGNYIAVFFPTNNPWPSEYTMPLVSSYGGNLGIMMGNFEDAEPDGTTAVSEETRETTGPAETEQTQPSTEAPTEPVVVIVATEPETEEEPIRITAAPTEETEAPVATEPAETEAREETQVPTVPAEPEEPVQLLGEKSWIGLVMIVGVLTFLIAGAVIFRILNRRGGRYRR